jgi:hypothetical protein
VAAKAAIRNGVVFEIQPRVAAHGRLSKEWIMRMNSWGLLGPTSVQATAITERFCQKNAAKEREKHSSRSTCLYARSTRIISERSKLAMNVGEMDVDTLKCLRELLEVVP